MTPKKYVVEITCTGNNGRSKPAAALLSKYLTEYGISKSLVDIITSGTIITQIENEIVPHIETVRSFLTQGCLRGDIFSPEEQQIALAVINKNPHNRVSELYRKVVNTFYLEETEFRNRFLPEFCPGVKVESERKQMIPLGNVTAFLGIEPAHTLFALEAYRRFGEPYPQIISTFGTYATGNPHTQISNVFGKSSAEYRVMLQSIDAYAKQVAANLIRDLDLS